MKKIFIIVVLSLFTLIACQRKAFAQTIENKSDTCLNVLKEYTKYWKKDSLGNNGFRELLGNRVLINCDCKGQKWEDVLKYLGEPDFKYIEKDKMDYRYRLNRYSDDIKKPGTLLLDITVNKKGLITSFVVWEVDG